MRSAACGLSFANGGCPEVSGRHEACIAGRTDGLNGLVISTIDFLSVFHKVVAGNAVYGGHAAGIDAGVADGGDGWDVGQGVPAGQRSG